MSVIITVTSLKIPTLEREFQLSVCFSRDFSYFSKGLLIPKTSHSKILYPFLSDVFLAEQMTFPRFLESGVLGHAKVFRHSDNVFTVLSLFCQGTVSLDSSLAAVSLQM